MEDTLKKTTPVQGTGVVKDNSQGAEQEQQGGQELEIQNPEGSALPDWVFDLMESNKAVIASNESVISAINDFKEAAPEVAAEIVKRVQETAAVSVGAASVLPVGENVKREIAKLKSKGKYVVAPGKKFQDKDTFAMHHAGHDVSHLSADRLSNLLSQGIIVEDSGDK